MKQPIGPRSSVLSVWPAGLSRGVGQRGVPFPIPWPQAFGLGVNRGIFSKHIMELWTQLWTQRTHHILSNEEPSLERCTQFRVFLRDLSPRARAIPTLGFLHTTLMHQVQHSLGFSGYSHAKSFLGISQMCVGFGPHHSGAQAHGRIHRAKPVRSIQKTALHHQQRYWPSRSFETPTEAQGGACWDICVALTGGTFLPGHFRSITIQYFAFRWHFKVVRLLQRE